MPIGFHRLVNGGKLSAALQNADADSLEGLGVYGWGRGVISGIVLSNGGGLTVAWTAGWVNTLAPKYIAAGSVTLAPSSTLYLWMDNEGNVSTTGTSTYPGGEVFCLGYVVTGVATITSIAETNRYELARMTAEGTYQIGKNAVQIDTLNDRVGIGGAPVAGVALNVTGDVAILGGHIKVGNTATIMVGTLTLTTSSDNVQIVTASGADRKILLPSPGPERWFDIVNIGATYDAHVRDAADANTIAVVRPGERMEFRPIGSGGAAIWGVARLGSELWRDVINATGAATGVSVNWETVCSFTIPMHALNEIKRRLHWDLCGTLTKSGGGTSPTVAWRITANGVVLVQSYATTYTGVGVLTDSYWGVRGGAGCVSVGATGTLRAAGQVFVPNATAAALIPVPMSNPAATGIVGPGTTGDTGAIDLTGDITLLLETQLSAATAGNQMKVQEGRVWCSAI